MKTLRTRLANLPSVQLVKRSVLLITAAVALAALNAQAQFTPLSVPSGGVGPITFDAAAPTPQEGWGTRQTPGGAGDITLVAAFDTAVNTNSASIITNQIPTDGGAIAFGTGNPMRWNSMGKFIESRPTGVSYNLLLLALRNDSGGDKTTVIINYDFGSQFPPGSYETEDDNGRLAGFRVYYSLTGAPTTWVHIPEFDGDTNNIGTRAATVTLASPWEAGANLYILWGDDNAAVGTAGTTGVIEGPWTIDNVKIEFQLEPIVIVTPPHNATVEECRGTNFTVVVTGTGPVYHWFKNNFPIGGNSSTLTIGNTVLSDNNSDYYVQVSNAVSSVSSAHVKLFVQQDNTPPTVDSALAKVNGTNVIVVFSEPMNPDPDSGAQAAFSYHLRAPDGTTTEPTTAVIAADGRTVTLHFDTPRTPNVNYQLLIDPAMGDACRPLANILTGPINPVDGRIIAPLKFEIFLMTFENTPWKYKADYIDPLTDWRLDPSFDDSGWSNGVSVLDGKQDTTTFLPTPRMTVGPTGMAVTTHLPLREPPGTTTTNIPCYYFRGHFTLPVPVSEVSALELRTYIDDFDVAWMNNSDTPFRRNPGNPLVNLDTFGYSGGAAVADAGILGPFSVDLANLRAGDNLVCAKVFQQAVASSDITFAYELIAVINSFPSAGPSLAISHSGGTVTITWTGSLGTLYQADTVDATGAAWTAVSGVTGNSYSFSAGTAAGQKFYTLRR